MATCLSWTLIYIEKLMAPSDIKYTANLPTPPDTYIKIPIITQQTNFQPSPPSYTEPEQSVIRTVYLKNLNC
jgi:hypothetical protein